MVSNGKTRGSVLTRLDSKGRRVAVITVVDTLIWLGATVLLAAIVGNSTALQVVSAIVFTILWYTAVKVWAR